MWYLYNNSAYLTKCVIIVKHTYLTKCVIIVKHTYLTKCVIINYKHIKTKYGNNITKL